jgi:hypothetical protein
MADKRKSVFDFQELSNRNTENKQENVSENISSITEQDSTTQKTNTEKKVASVTDNTKTETEQGTDLLNSFKQTKKLRVEDTHSRYTVLIDNELLKEINRVAKGKGKGFKTWFFNYALKMMLEEIKDNK